ncbi:MAG: hypothetical protein WCJ37_00825 [Syntrophus sp. (in: bacteria)]
MIDKKNFIPYIIGLFFVILFWDQSRNLEEVSSFFAYVSAILFAVANAYYPARLISREFKPLPKMVVAFFRKYLKVHIWMNLVAFVAMIIHCHYSEELNIFLVGTYIVTFFLTIEGIVMHYRLIPGEQKLLRMIHAQQVLFVVWVVLIFLGHWD